MLKFKEFELMFKMGLVIFGVIGVLLLGWMNLEGQRRLMRQEIERAKQEKPVQSPPEGAP